MGAGSSSSPGPTVTASTSTASAPSAGARTAGKPQEGFTGEREGNRYVKGLLLGETLGKGTFGYVKLGINEKDGTQYALKFLLRNARRFKEDTVKLEIDCMKRIKHKNVVNLLHSDYHCPYPNQEGKIDDTVLMVLEYAPGGDLYDILFYSGKLDEKLARTYYIQLLEGLDAIHKAGITHRDLKANNVLLDHKFRLKITDFGLSHIFEGEDLNTNRMKTCWVGTKGYQAPELILNRPYTNKCDVFSTGVVLFTLLTGHQPFKRAAANDPWYKCIAAKKYYKFWKSHSKDQLSENVKNILEMMMAYQPRERWTIPQLQDHPWCKENSYSEGELVKVMRALHSKTVQNKRNDQNRQERHQQSQNRAMSDMGECDEWCNKFQEYSPPEVNFPLPAFNTYQLKEPESPLKIIYAIKNAAADMQAIFNWVPEQFKARVTMTATKVYQAKKKAAESHEFKLHVTARIVNKKVNNELVPLVVFLREYEIPSGAAIDVECRNGVYDEFLTVFDMNGNLGEVFHDDEDYDSAFNYDTTKVAAYFDQFNSSDSPHAPVAPPQEEEYPVLPDITVEDEEEVQAAPAQ